MLTYLCQNMPSTNLTSYSEQNKRKVRLKIVKLMAVKSVKRFPHSRFMQHLLWYFHANHICQNMPSTNVTSCSIQNKRKNQVKNLKLIIKIGEKISTFAIYIVYSTSVPTISVRTCQEQIYHHVLNKTKDKYQVENFKLINNPSP